MRIKLWMGGAANRYWPIQSLLPRSPATPTFFAATVADPARKRKKNRNRETLKIFSAAAIFRISIAIDQPSEWHSTIVIERNVRLRRPANPGCSRYAHTAAAAAAARHTAPTTNHHRAPTLRMFTASAGGAGRWARWRLLAHASTRNSASTIIVWFEDLKTAVLLLMPFFWSFYLRLIHWSCWGPSSTYSSAVIVVTKSLLQERMYLSCIYWLMNIRYTHNW